MKSAIKYLGRLIGLIKLIFIGIAVYIFLYVSPEPLIDLVFRNLFISRPPDFPPTFVAKPNNGETALVFSAYQQVRKLCPNTDRYWADIELTESRVNSPAIHPLGQQAGWVQEIEFVIKYRKTDPKWSIPVAFHPKGQQVHLRIGSGHRPGLIVTDKESALFCNVIYKQNIKSVFVDYTGFANLVIDPLSLPHSVSSQ